MTAYRDRDSFFLKIFGAIMLSFLVLGILILVIWATVFRDNFRRTVVPAVTMTPMPIPTPIPIPVPVPAPAVPAPVRVLCNTFECPEGYEPNVGTQCPEGGCNKDLCCKATPLPEPEVPEPAVPEPPTYKKVPLYFSSSGNNNCTNTTECKSPCMSGVVYKDLDKIGMIYSKDQPRPPDSRPLYYNCDPKIRGACTSTWKYCQDGEDVKIYYPNEGKLIGYIPTKQIAGTKSLYFNRSGTKNYCTSPYEHCNKDGSGKPFYPQSIGSSIGYIFSS